MYDVCKSFLVRGRTKAPREGYCKLVSNCTDWTFPAVVLPLVVPRAVGPARRWPVVAQRLILSQLRSSCRWRRTLDCYIGCRCNTLFHVFEAVLLAQFYFLFILYLHSRIGPRVPNRSPEKSYSSSIWSDLHQTGRIALCSSKIHNNTLRNVLYVMGQLVVLALPIQVAGWPQIIF